MTSQDKNLFTNYKLNYRSIAESPKVLRATSELARFIIKHTHCTIGHFLERLTDEELDSYQKIAEEMLEKAKYPNAAPPKNYSDIVLITQMLAEAEGVSEKISLDRVTSRVGQMALFITLETLYRKKMIIFHRDNVSFGEDMYDKVVAERINESE